MRLAYTLFLALLFSFFIHCSGGSTPANEVSADPPPPVTCGNTALDVPEQCDDGNTTGNDGCGVTCLNENAVAADGVWVSGTLIAENKVLFVLPVTPGEVYGVYWHDTFYGDGSQTAYALKVSAYNEDHSTTWFSQAFSGYASPRAFTADASSFANIVVEGYYASTAGTFQVKVVAGNEQHNSALANNITYDGYLIKGATHTYNFGNLVPNLPYYLTWNDKYDGDATKTAWLLKVGATNGDNSTTYFTSQHSGYTTPREVLVDATAAVNATIEGWYETTQGSYSITLFSYCGNGALEPTKDELCDDGNNISNDGCSAACDIEGTLDLAANNTTVIAGMPEQFTSFFTDHLSNVTDVTDSVTYYVSDPSVGYFSDRFEERGMFIPLKGGTVDVHATYGNDHTSNVVTVTVTYPATAGSLLINEIYDGHNGFYNNPWVEIINTGAEAANLGLYQLRTPSYDYPPTTYGSSTIFDLPDMTIPPGGYVRLIASSSLTLETTLQVTFVNDGVNRLPYLIPSGSYVELLKGGVTQDFIRWGTSTATPTTAGHWDTSAAPALPLTIGQSIGRDGASSDANTGSDWTTYSYITPNGPNDVACTTDDDNDGIPDCSELPGTTYAGLNLYDLGARQSQRDLFVEVDYMASNVPGKVLWPIRETFDRLIPVFAARGIALHIDIGDLYDQTAGINPANYDLGGGNEVPYHQHLSVGGSADGVTKSVRSYRYAYMDLRRHTIFNYALYGDRSPPDFAFGGQAEINGNEFVMTLGHHTQSYNSASTFMHELGHNLGLGHGGDTHVNYKPNYFSVMNYMYSGPLGYIGTADEGYIFLRSRYTSGDSCYPAYNSALYNDYQLDFSDGSMPSLDENSLNETNGISGSGFWVDFNCNGAQNTATAVNLNPFYDSTLEVLTDHNDWANLNLRIVDMHASDYFQGHNEKVAAEATPEQRRNHFIKHGKLKDRHSRRFPVRPQR